MYLDGFGKFFCDFCPIFFFFLPLLNKFWAKNSLFWQFLKNTIFSQKYDSKIDSSWNSLSRNAYF